MMRRARPIFRPYFGEAAGEYRRARFYLMSQIVHMFYAVVFMLLGSKGKSIESNTKAPDFRDFHDRIRAGGVSLASDERKVEYAKVHMNELLQNLRAVRFQDALRIISMGTPWPGMYATIRAFLQSRSMSCSDGEPSRRIPRARAVPSSISGSNTRRGSARAASPDSPWPADVPTGRSRTPYFSTGRSTRSNSAAWRVKPRSVGCEPSTVPSPSSPSRLAPSR
jgi:hypothetical protein